jgi:hypothetical protein
MSAAGRLLGILIVVYLPQGNDCMNFEWHPRKVEINLRKQGVSFSESGIVFGDDLAITVPDPDHSKNENRYITIG